MSKPAPCQQGPVVHTAVNPSCQAGTPSGNFLQAVSLLSFWLLSLNTYADLIKICQQGAKKNIPTVQLGDGFVFSFFHTFKAESPFRVCIKQVSNKNLTGTQCVLCARD